MVRALRRPGGRGNCYRRSHPHPSGGLAGAHRRRVMTPERGGHRLRVPALRPSRRSSRAVLSGPMITKVGDRGVFRYASRCTEQNKPVTTTFFSSCQYYGFTRRERWRGAQVIRAIICTAASCRVFRRRVFRRRRGLRWRTWRWWRARRPRLLRVRHRRATRHRWPYPHPPGSATPDHRRRFRPPERGGQSLRKRALRPSRRSSGAVLSGPMITKVGDRGVFRYASRCTEQNKPVTTTFFSSCQYYGFTRRERWRGAQVVRAIICTRRVFRRRRGLGWRTWRWWCAGRPRLLRVRYRRATRRSRA